MKIDMNAKSRNSRIAGPSVAPFSSHHALQAKSRSIAVDAAACFLATALGSLSPYALGLFDAIASKPTAVQMTSLVDSESGKFTDRVLIGGLQSLSWDDESRTPSAPAFTTVPIRSSGAETAVAAHSRPVLSPKGTKRAVGAPEVKLADAAPAPAAAPTVAATEPAAEQKAEDRGLLAALTPSAVSAKVTEKALAGVKTVGGAVTSGLSWLGY